MVKRSFIIIAALVLAAATAGCAAGPQEYVTIPAPMATQANGTAAPVEPAPAPTPTAEPTNERQSLRRPCRRLLSASLGTY